ncbi:MAG: RagB/SusD family nutrient uptake outer membrane protein [Bacteroidota bacterium]
MKKTAYLLILALMMATSCDSDLELSPQDSLTPDNFYSNPANFESALFGIYDALQSRGMYDFVSLSDAISDNGVAQFVSVSDFEEFGKAQQGPAVNNTILDYYEDPFIVIQRANSLLENIDNEGLITEEERNAIRAEARALRAISYARLVYFFGDVPLMTTVLNRSELLELIRDPRQEVITFVLTELAEAASALGTAPFNGQSGRLTRQAVLGMLARYSLFEARLGNIPWEQALTAANNAKASADSGGNRLFVSGDGSNGEMNYKEIFYEANEDNGEILFGVKFDALDQAEPSYERYGVLGGTLYMTVHENLVNDFYTTDGLPITEGNSIFDVNDPYSNRDPRLAANVIVPGSLFSNGGELVELTATSNTNAATPFFVRKQVTKNGDEGITLNDNNDATLDVIVLRYAELLLMLSEAENEVNGPTALAYGGINQVRSRVGMPNVQTGLSQAEFRDEVIHERRVELPFEGTRWLDLITLGIADERINGINEGLGRVFVPNQQEVFPIPQIEIDRIPSLSQNPGY